MFLTGRKQQWTDNSDPLQTLDPVEQEDKALSRWQGLSDGGGKGGGGGGSTTSTNYTSNLPEYAEPYYRSLMERSEAVSQLPYTAYQGDRIAGFSPTQQTAQQGVADLYGYGNPAMDTAQQYASFGTNQALNTQYNPNAIDPTSMYAQDPNQQNLWSDVDTELFDQQWRDFYMSPYMDSVVQSAQDDAILQDQRQGVLRDSEAAQAGAFGGSRQAVSDYLAEEGLQDRLSDIFVTGRQSAFENAQGMFGEDQARRLQADLANQGAGLQGADLGLRADLGNLDAFMESELANESGRQFASQLDLDAANLGITGAGVLGDLGQAGQASELERISALENVGAQQQGLQQLLMDQAYQDFTNQRDYERNALTWLSGVMHGVPVSADSNTMTSAPPPNPLSQLAGLGIAGVGLYNALS